MFGTRPQRPPTLIRLSPFVRSRRTLHDCATWLLLGLIVGVSLCLIPLAMLWRAVSGAHQLRPR